MSTTTGKELVMMAKEEEEEEEEEKVMAYLNEDMITKIIISTKPPESLFKSLRYVCKPWYNIINNHPDIPLNRLLTSKPPCLILQTRDHSSVRHIKSVSSKELSKIQGRRYPTFTTRFIKMGMEGSIEEEFDLTTPSLKELFILACSNGIMLVTPDGVKSDLKILHLVNPLTNQFIILPPPQVESYLPQLIFLPSSSSSTYKVVVGTGPPPDDDDNKMMPKYIHVLTFSTGVFSSSNDDDNVVVDDLKWRHVEAPQILESQPLAINGILYWVAQCDGIKQHILSFDATTEIFYTTPHPFYKQVSCYSGRFIEMGGYLAFWCIPSFSKPPTSLIKDTTCCTKLDVWILKKDSNEWRKQYSVGIDINFIKPKDDHIRPVLSCGNGQVLIFYNIAKQTLWAYNVKTKQWWPLRTNLIENDYFKFYGFHVRNILDLESIFVPK